MAEEVDTESTPQAASNQTGGPVSPGSFTQGVTTNIEEVGSAQAPQPEVKEVEDTTVVFVPFEDFDGRINQENYSFRKDVPVKVPKAEANVWLEAKKGYTK